MSFKIGIVGLCTSHPDAWTNIIKEFNNSESWDVDIVAAWDSGETRPEGFTREFCEKHQIPNVVENLADMVDKVDGVIVHSANWDSHIEQARLFVAAGKAILLDKPVAGCLKDINQILDWIEQGRCIIGGSSLRFNKDVLDFLGTPVEERGEVHTAYSAIGVDDFNYGIHGYAMLCCLMGAGIRSVKYLGASRQNQFMLTWENGNIAFLTAGKAKWLPFNITVTTTENVFHIVAGKDIYQNFIKTVFPYFIGKEDKPPLTARELVEPALAALAARVSRQNHGAEIFLDDLSLSDDGYDGRQFAVEYRRARLAK